MSMHSVFLRLEKRKIYFLPVFYSIFFSLTIRGAIAFDNASSANTTSNSSSLTFSHTVSGSDRILIVGVTHKSTSASISSVKYNNVNLTLCASTSFTGFDDSYGVSLWYLVAPATGANNVVVTTSASTEIIAGAHSYTGVDQDTPIGTSATNFSNTTTTSASVTVSSAAGELVVDALGTDFWEPTVAASQTERYNRSKFAYAAGSSKDGAASVTMTWTFASDEWGIVAVPLKPVDALPVELLHFNATCLDEKKAQLEWTTASETNNDFFTIEQSVDGIYFEEIDAIKGAGNSSMILHYSVIINIPHGNAPYYYYRLKQTDFDGKWEYAGLISLKPDCEDSLIIYPCLTDGIVKIIIGNRTATISVFDINGRKISEESMKGNSKEKIIDLRSFSKGIYSVSVQTGQKTFFQKIVLQ